MFASPGNCSNKWCTTKGFIPATGNLNGQCGDLRNLEYNRIVSGGISGRGVSPCPLGLVNNTPFNGIVTRELMYFDPQQIQGFTPPQGTLRPLQRIGNDWRSN